MGTEMDLKLVYCHDHLATALSTPHQQLQTMMHSSQIESITHRVTISTSFSSRTLIAFLTLKQDRKKEDMQS